MPSRLPLLARRAGALARIPLTAYVAAAVLAVAGTACIYWPAALLVAAGFCLAVAL